jgi:diguanylate cyclase (GGDEF)-like protein
MPSADHDAAALMLVLDTVGGLLQAYAQNSFDTDLWTRETIRARLQQWRMHALIGAPQPDAVGEAGGSTIGDRNWHGLLRFFGETRRDEVAFVSRSHGDLRESLWAFVGTIHHLMLEEHVESRTVRTQLDQVREAAAGNDMDRLKRDTIAALVAMETLLATRRARQQKRFSGLADRLKTLGREIDESRREGCVDALTNLPNRRHFDEYIRQCIELGTITGRPACLIMVDVDDFKRINDTHGHALGDDALRQVSTALSRTILRKIDFVCRHGGDEFAVILQETDGASGKAIGEKIRRALRDVLDTPRANEQDLDYTLSIGVAELVMGDDAASWSRRADAALYDAKRLGKNRVALGGAAQVA